MLQGRLLCRGGSGLYPPAAIRWSLGRWKYPSEAIPLDSTARSLNTTSQRTIERHGARRGEKRLRMKTKVQIIFYSMYGHVYRLAEAVAQGAKEVTDVETGIFQVPELVPDNILEQSGANKARAAFSHIPVARIGQLSEADAIIFGTPTRFGNMCSQM